MMFADFPPSSNDVLFRSDAVRVAMSRAAMLDQRHAGLLAEAEHRVVHAVGQARLLEDLAQHLDRQRRQLGRLVHGRVAVGQARRHLPRGQHERPVPRRDEAVDTGRVGDRVGEQVVVAVERLVAGQLLLLGEEPEVPRRPLGDRVRAAMLGPDGATHLQRLQIDDVVGAGLDQIGDLAQHLAAQRRLGP